MSEIESQPVSLEVQSESEDQTMNLAAAIAQRLQPGDFVALEGQLGSGKTCFVRGLAKGLGIDHSAIASPTFVIIQEHVGSRATLIHVDAYRLSGEDELETIGWSELLADGRTIVAVEWPSRIAAALPPRRIDVAISHRGIHERTIVLSAPSELADRIADLRLNSTTKSRLAKCATCGKSFNADADSFPFCSQRCRMADLGRWFAGRYRVSRPMGEQDIDEQSLEQ